MKKFYLMPVPVLPTYVVFAIEIMSSLLPKNLACLGLRVS
jgi:hypothetical protein